MLQPRRADPTQAQGMPDRNTFLQPSKQLLRIADSLRKEGNVVEAGKYGYAAFMHAGTRGTEETLHGKLLMPQYALSEDDKERAMVLWTDGLKRSERALKKFTDWFNDTIQCGGGPENELIGEFDIAWRQLSDAAQEGDLMALREAISWGTDLNKMGRTGPVLELAAVHGHLQCVLALLDSGAKAWLQGPQGNTALHGAAYYGRVEVLSALLAELQRHHVHPDIADDNGNTPLNAAVANTAEASTPDRKECVQMLLSHGADAQKAFSTGAHPSVIPMLAEALGKVVDEKVLAKIKQKNDQQEQATEQAWSGDMARAVESGMLTEKEARKLKEDVTRCKPQARRTQRMTELLEDLKACKLGDRSVGMPAGCLICLHGLEAKPELNGAGGRLIAFEAAKGRYVVELERDGKKSRMLVKPQNVKRGLIPGYDELSHSGLYKGSDKSTDESTDESGRDEF